MSLTTPGAGLSAQPRPAAVAWWRVLSWQMYDFADTIYSMNVVSYAIGVYIMFTFSVNSAVVGWSQTAANLCVALTAPLLGAMSDASQRRLPFLRLFAVLTALFTMLIPFASTSYPLTLLCFVLSYFFYQSAGQYYQALLPGLCNEENVSRVSGVGVALGYVGSIVGIGSVMLYVDGNPDYYKIFIPSALMFLFFALPGLTVVPDFAPPTQPVRLDVGAAYRRVAETFRNASKHPVLFRFLIADFIYENAVAAVVGFMTVYAKVVVGFADADLQLFFIFSTVFAVGFSFFYGWLTDRIGPKRAVIYMLLIWLVTFPLVTLAQTPYHFRFVGPLVGMGLGATWISSRTFLIALTPARRSAEFFGLYSLSGKSASVLGVLVWTLVLEALIPTVGEVAALKSNIWVMWLFIIVGLLMVLKLPDVRPTKENVLDRSQM